MTKILFFSNKVFLAGFFLQAPFQSNQDWGSLFFFSPDTRSTGSGSGAAGTDFSAGRILIRIRTLIIQSGPYSWYRLYCRVHGRPGLYPQVCRHTVPWPVQRSGLKSLYSRSKNDLFSIIGFSSVFARPG
jgi:hypothetical protein